MQFSLRTLTYLLAFGVTQACGGSGDGDTGPGDGNGNGGGGTVPPSVASVAINPTTLSLTVGATAVIVATPLDASGSPLSRTVTWHSADSTIAAVSSSGMVTGRALGTVGVTATSEGSSSTATVTVSVAVAQVVVSPATVALVVGGTGALGASAKDAAGNVLAGRVFTWVSSAPSVATVDPNGIVTGVSAGTTTVAATTGGSSGAATVTVSLPAVASVVLTPSSGVLLVGATGTFGVAVLDASGNQLTGRAVVWGSSNTSVATISSSGVATAVSVGSSTITASAGDVSGSAVLTVLATEAPVAAVTLSPSAASLQVGSSGVFVVTLTDASGNTLTNRTITWTSGNPGVASVNSATGLVTGLSPGTVQIAATSETKVGTATLVVTPPQVSVCSLIAGASVVANNGTFLGKLTNKYATQSVENQYGLYGSPYSATSIFNTYGQYGGQYSVMSPFNPYTTTPPVLVVNNTAVAYLSANQYLSGLPIVSPAYLSLCTFP